MIESKKVWMYSTIGLAAILAVGFSFPQAFAHITSSVSHNVGHILDAIAALHTDVDDIQTEVSTNVVEFGEYTVTYAFTGGSTTDTLAIAPTGNAIRGHATLSVNDNDDTYEVHCDSVVLAASGGADPNYINTDFVCERLFISATDVNSNTSGPTVDGFVYYVVDPIDSSVG